jgi:hypothetical protein
MAGLSEQTDQTSDPSISLGSMGRNRYPNQFFDLAQQYMPPTIKELFRWCTFYFYNSPLIGSSITKISRYPITDLILDDEHESVRDLWDQVLNRELKMKDRLMEINLDYHVYGNAFVSIHLPFTRFLICRQCHERHTISAAKWTFNTTGYEFYLNCKCGRHGTADVKDVPYKDRRGVRLIRWNPENIMVKYNEYTGKRLYMYSVPYKLKNAITRGDKDIVSDIPLIVIQALKERRLIRFSEENFMHLRRPTLAEQDQGWGKPLIIHVLKDMYYLYTLRRAQEAIALEHIVPFDIIYPMPNAQQDPYIHSDLSNWRQQIENVIGRHRRDPNFKAVIPIPVGFGRLGGDGKAMMLSPEMNYLTQTIVGGMGIPQEFLFGGLNWTGSSISLRTLENDFMQNRSQLLDLVHWIKDKYRVWLNLPNIEEIRFADFRMADDVQRNQQLIGLNAQMKVSDQTLLTELGYNYDHEVKKMIEEVYLQNYLNDLRAKGQAKTQGEAQIIGMNYQNKINELAQKAQASAQARMQAMGMEQPQPQMEQQPVQQEQPQPGGWQQDVSSGLQPESGTAVDQDIGVRIKRWTSKLTNMAPPDAKATIQELKVKMPDIGSAVEKEYNGRMAGGGLAKSIQPNMNPLPEQQAPTRAGIA